MLRLGLKVVAINIVVLIAIVWAFEWTSNFFKEDQLSLEKDFSDEYQIAIDELGWGAKPNVDSQVVATYGDEKIYDVTYKFDEFGRRITDYDPSPNRKRFAIFLGGSQTFGEGVASDQNIPATFAKNVTDVVPYNYAFQGYGPQQVYEIVQSKRLPAEVSEAEGVAFYFYKPFHRNRLVGTSQVLAWSGGQFPYLYLDKNDQIQRQKTFKDGRPFNWIYEAPGHSSLLQNLGIQLPNPFSEYSNKLLCKVMEKINADFKAQFPKGKLVVLADYDAAKTKDNIINTCLKGLNIPFIDFTVSFFEPVVLTEGHSLFVHKFGVDQHYNAFGARRIGEFLAEWYLENFSGQ